MSEQTDIDRERLRSAWRCWTDTLSEQADAIIDGKLGDARDADEMAQCLRAMARMSNLCLTQQMDYNDADFPVFLRQMDDRFRYGGPDTNISYLRASIRGGGGAKYRVRGNNANQQLNIQHLWKELTVRDEDGSFEAIASAEPEGDNWIPLPADLDGETYLPKEGEMPLAGIGMQARRYDWNWAEGTPPGWLSIERIDEGRPDYPAPLSPAKLAEQVERAANLFRSMSNWWLARPARIRSELDANVITPPGTTPPGIKVFNAPMDKERPWLVYGVMPFDIGPDDALLIESALPDADYWSFTLYNVWWEAPDVQHRQTALNHNQAVLDDDGRIRLILSRRDPGVPNWLDPGDCARGFMFFRWFHPDGAYPAPSCRKLHIDEVRAALPKKHPHVSAEQRRATISARREQLARIFQR